MGVRVGVGDEVEVGVGEVIIGVDPGMGVLVGLGVRVGLGVLVGLGVRIGFLVIRCLLGIEACLPRRLASFILLLTMNWAMRRTPNKARPINKNFFIRLLVFTLLKRFAIERLIQIKTIDYLLQVGK